MNSTSLSVNTSTSPPDLEIRVREGDRLSEKRLLYSLNSPTGVAPFSHKEIVGPAFKVSPDELHRSLLNQIEELSDGFDLDKSLALPAEVTRKLDGIGRNLWRELFSEEMREAYRNFRDRVRTISIISDEPWIPWEMIKPFDSQEGLDDDFLGARFELTRWLAGDRTAPGTISARALCWIGQSTGCPMLSASIPCSRACLEASRLFVFKA